jgi:hypothetical protein
LHLRGSPFLLNSVWNKFITRFDASVDYFICRGKKRLRVFAVSGGVKFCTSLGDISVLSLDRGRKVSSTLICDLQSGSPCISL